MWPYPTVIGLWLVCATGLVTRAGRDKGMVRTVKSTLELTAAVSAAESLVPVAGGEAGPPSTLSAADSPATYPRFR